METCFELRPEKLYVLGVFGKLEKSLKDVGVMCADDLLEFAPVKEEVNRDFLAGFYHPPGVDVTLAKSHRNSDCSVVAYSLSEQEARGVVGGVVRESGFHVRRPDVSFVSQITGEFPIEIGTYKMVKEMAGVLGVVSLEQMWGVPKYANFLRYCGVPESQALGLAVDKLGLPDDVKKMLGN
jgi:hypothetical protein